MAGKRPSTSTRKSRWASRRSCFWRRVSAFRIAGGCPTWYLNLQLLEQLQKPAHAAGRFQPHQHRPRERAIEVPHPRPLVRNRLLDHLSGLAIQHRNRLLRPASFDPSAVRGEHRTVYAGRRGADVVKASLLLGYWVIALRK
jgi:hypothetical protein